MLSSTSGLSPSDVLALSGNGNNGGFGDMNGGWWFIIILALLFGVNGNGSLFGGSNGSGVANGYVLSSDFSNLSRQIDNGFDGIRQQNVAIANGISSLGYDQLSQMNGINQNISNTGYSVQSAIQADTVANMQNANAIQSQLASCCCSSKEAIADLGYNLATQSCSTRQAVADSTASILNAIKDMQTSALQDKISELQASNQALQFAASQQAQNNVLINALRPSPIPSYTVSNPYYYGTYGTTIA